VVERLRAAGLRIEVDTRSQRMQHKIRDAQLQKVPYMLVVGDRDAASGAVSVRLRSGEDLGPISFEDFRNRILDQVAARK
jgi:threonyl-tRNA synthetase